MRVIAEACDAKPLDMLPETRSPARRGGHAGFPRCESTAQTYIISTYEAISSHIRCDRTGHEHGLGSRRLRRAPVTYNSSAAGVRWARRYLVSSDVVVRLGC